MVIHALRLEPLTWPFACRSGLEALGVGYFFCYLRNLGFRPASAGGTQLISPSPQSSISIVVACGQQISFSGKKMPKARTPRRPRRHSFMVGAALSGHGRAPGLARVS